MGFCSRMFKATAATKAPHKSMWDAAWSWQWHGAIFGSCHLFFQPRYQVMRSVWHLWWLGLTRLTQHEAGMEISGHPVKNLSNHLEIDADFSSRPMLEGWPTYQAPCTIGWLLTLVYMSWSCELDEIIFWCGGPYQYTMCVEETEGFSADSSCFGLMAEQQRMNNNLHSWQYFEVGSAMGFSSEPWLSKMSRKN